MPKNIVIAGFNEKELLNLKKILETEGYLCQTTSSQNTFRSLTKKTSIDLIITDNNFAKETYKNLQDKQKINNIPFILLQEINKESKEPPKINILSKPFSTKKILKTVKTFLKIHRLLQIKEMSQVLIKKQKDLNSELKIASEIQKNLLPQNLPKIAKLDIDYKFIPCEKIGGDILNIIPLGKDFLAIYILDVSGHGIPASLITFSISQFLKAEEDSLLKNNKPLSPKKLIANLNCEYPIERFNKHFTILYLLINLKDGKISYCNAAHPRGILLRKDGTIETLDKGGTIIGLNSKSSFEEEKQLKSGDKIFLYTDGLSEYQNKNLKPFGTDKLCKTLIKLKKYPVSTILDKTLETLIRFSPASHNQDDISIIGLEYI